MQDINYAELENIAYEAFIRRASQTDMPFALKGSYITRQYFQNPEERVPADLDWIYLSKINDPEAARNIFDEWMIAITELVLNDGVVFRSFRENQFWRMMDYAMADDFPTVNTDLVCWVDGQEIELHVDISFNLEIPDVPIPLRYKPVRGAEFDVKYTVPLSLQIAWKIHQTIVRPRFKDIFDLMHLVKHASLTRDVLRKTMAALKEECEADNVAVDKIAHFFNYRLHELFAGNSMEESWNYWRHNITEGNLHTGERAEAITNADNIPETLSGFSDEFATAMSKAGLNDELFIKTFPVRPDNTAFFSSAKAGEGKTFWTQVKKIFKQ